LKKDSKYGEGDKELYEKDEVENIGEVKKKLIVDVK
jgi:hypothetical protein